MHANHSNQALVNKLKEAIHDFFPQLVGIRQYLHAHPELSFEEHKTAEYIKTQLQNLGVTSIETIATTGLKVVIDSGRPGPTRALRADIDALPIMEENSVAYKSTNPGVMHACGHDVHTTCLLGAIHLLLQFKADWNGKVICIFQPGEEKLPGGARLMLDSGVFDDDKPDFIIGQHVQPSMQVGTVGQKAGMYMASADEIYLTVKGKGGHAAMPQEVVDPIIVASHILINLQNLVARQANPTIPTVLSFGKINSTGGATNVIPSEVKIEGTFRTLNEQWRKKAHQLITEICQQTAKTFGATCEVNIMVGYPFLENNAAITAHVKRCMVAYLGDEAVEDLPIRMTSEDFAFFAQELPACFYRLGTGNVAKGIVSAVHMPTFDIDEEALQIGAGLMAYIAMTDF